MNDRERLAFLTSEYNRLKGLRFAPAYVFFILTPWIEHFGLWSLRETFIRVGIFLVVCIVWFWILNRYYKQRYGRIEESPDRQKRRFTTLPMMLPGLIAWYFLFQERTPLNTLSLFLPAFLLSEGLGASNIGFRRSYYLGAGVITLLVELSALFQGIPGHLFFRIYQFSIWGTAMLIVSVLDHLLLVRTFRQSAREIGA